MLPLFQVDLEGFFILFSNWFGWFGFSLSQDAVFGGGLRGADVPDGPVGLGARGEVVVWGILLGVGGRPILVGFHD